MFRNKFSKIVTVMLVMTLLVAPLQVRAEDTAEMPIVSNEFQVVENEEVVDPVENEVEEIENDIQEMQEEAMEEATGDLSESEAEIQEQIPTDENEEVDENEDTVETATADDFVTFSGEFASADDEQTYEVAIDFTTMDTAAICLVRTGCIGAVITIYDEAGTKIIARGVSEKQGKNWYFLDKPDESATICKYKIVATPQSYRDDLSSYRVMVGEKDDAELMMSGIENTVLLDMYFEEDLNFQSATYSPNQYEYWFKYKKGVYDTVTILLKDNNIRFRIVDVETLKEVYNSNDYQSDVHRTKFLGSGAFTCAEKINSPSGTKVGKEYYLIVYNLKPNSTSGLVEKGFLTAVGKPVMCATGVNIYPNKSVSMSKSGYRSFMYEIKGSSIPKTGQVRTITLYGTSITNLKNWRAKAPNKSSWGTSSTNYSTIDMGFKKDSTANANLAGTWEFAFKASANAKKTTFTPYFSISYYYEYGD